MDVRVMYDLASTPKELGPANVIKIMENHRTIFWDSNNGGTKPTVYAGIDPITKEKTELMLVDTAGKVIDIEAYQKDFEEVEKWDKELHRCQRSPIYFFTHYGSGSYPIKDAELKKYLVSVGVSDIEMKDSETAEDVWKSQQAAVEDAMKDVTVEGLQVLKGKMKILKNEYNRKVTAMEKKHEGNVNIKDSEGALLDEKKRVLNVAKAISRIKTIPAKYADYNFKKQEGRWDKAMLNHTDYGVLLEMYDELFVL